MPATRLGTLATSLALALIAAVFAWQLSAGLSVSRVLLCLLLTSPLWIVLRGLSRRSRKAFAGATLAVIPYFVLGLTEAVANPDNRLWAAACLGIALALFVTLILYLRASNPQRPAQSVE